MRATLAAPVLLLASASPVAAAPAEGPVNLLDPNVGLMVWTVVIFVLLLFVLRKWAFPAILSAVEARERALAEALAEAKRDREEAAKFLASQQAQLDAARADAQRMIADGRSVGEKLRAEMIEQARREHQEMLERARREIEGEKNQAIADLRRAAVELALAGASKVLERNIDDAANRRMVEEFLAEATPRVGRR